MIFPNTRAKWWNLLLIWAGGTLGFIVNPILWFTWLYVPWLAFLAGTAANESDYLADPPVTDEPQSRGSLQFNEESRTLPFPLESFGMDDWRLSPFWSGFAAAFYISAVMWSTPLWWTMVIPIYGIAIARYSWVHSTSEESARLAMTDAWGEWWRGVGDDPPLHRNAYIAWHIILCTPPTLMLAASWAMRGSK